MEERTIFSPQQRQQSHPCTPEPQHQQQEQQQEQQHEQEREQQEKLQQEQQQEQEHQQQHQHHEVHPLSQCTDLLATEPYDPNQSEAERRHVEQSEWKQRLGYTLTALKRKIDDCEDELVDLKTKYKSLRLIFDDSM